MINHDKLIPGMIVGVSGAILKPFSIIERWTVAGFKNAFNKKICTHIAIVCKSHGLFYLVEMVEPKIRMKGLSEYEGHYTFVALPPELKSLDKQYNVNQFLLQAHADAVKYGTIELLRFWGFKIPERGQEYCSELARHSLDIINQDYPEHWRYAVEPYAMQIYSKVQNWNVEGVLS